MSSLIVRSYQLLYARGVALRASRAARNTLLLLGNSLVTGAGGIFFWLVTARTYSQETVGVATAGTSMVILLSGVSQLGLGIAIVRYSALLGPRRRRRLAGIFAVTLVAALLIGIVFWKLVPSVAPGLLPAFTTPISAAVFIASCIAWTLSLQYDNYLMSIRSMGLLLLKSGLIAACRIAMIVAFSALPVALIIGITGLSGLVGVLGVAPFVRANISASVETLAAPVPTRTLVRYSFWNYLSGLAGTTPSLVMPAIIVSFLGGEQAAAYYMAWTLFSILLLIPSAISWTLLSEGAATEAAGRRWHGQAFQNTAGLMLVLTTLFVPAAMLVMMFLGKTYAHHGAVVLLVLAAGVLPYHHAVLLMGEMRLHGSQSRLATAFTLSQAAVVAGSVPFLTIFGIAGVALAWTAGQYVLLAALRVGPLTSWKKRGRR